MPYRESPPDPRLSRFVECFGASTDAGAPQPVRVVPDGCVDLLFTIAGDGREVRAEVFGTKTRALEVRDSEPVGKLAVRFRPGAARRFLGRPAHEFADAAVELGQLWPDAAELAARIAAASGFAARRALLTRALLARLGRAEVPDALAELVDSAIARIAGARGALQVAALAT